jgi:hypothetical protein
MMKEIIATFSNEHPYVPASGNNNTSNRKTSTSNQVKDKASLVAEFKRLSMK